MQTVPFDVLGPGQKGRLIYQVLGKDGPIMNPMNIRYLRPDDAGVMQSSLQSSQLDLAVGISAANLICSAGTLAISAYTAQQVAALHEKIDYLSGCAGRIEQQSQYIASKVEVIDTKVSENNLRHALVHVLGKAISRDGVDLQRLAALRKDIDVFTDAIPSPLLFNFGVRLSSDVRDNLQRLAGLLLSVRDLVAHRHNMTVDAHPGRVVFMNPESEYFFGELPSFADTAILHDRMMRLVGEVAQGIGAEVYNHFTFADEDDANHFQSIVLDQLAKPAEELFADRAVVGKLASLGLPQEIFANEDNDAVRAQIVELSRAWLWQSDAGLVHRTEMELAALSDGYHESVWSHLDWSGEAEFNQIDVVCDLPSLDHFEEPSEVVTPRVARPFSPR